MNTRLRVTAACSAVATTVTSLLMSVGLVPADGDVPTPGGAELA